MSQAGIGLAALAGQGIFGPMGNSLAIVVAALIIALTIAFTSRWSIAVGPTNEAGITSSGLRDYARLGVYRLDRWTGAVVWCGQQALPSPMSASPFTCDVK
jgi:hypothetical protein